MAESFMAILEKCSLAASFLASVDMVRFANPMTLDTRFDISISY